ncbi:MAG: hypothetical protein WAV72_14130 [Bradyrhizobium sp.]
MTTPNPKTAADARKLVDELTSKRDGLQAVLDSGAQRRKGHATAAEFGDARAAASLRAIEVEETSARGALQNLDLVITEIEQQRDNLQAREAEDVARQHAEELSAAIDRLLALDDEIDDTLDRARELFAKREALANSALIRGARIRPAGLVTQEQEMGISICGYFDTQLGWLMRGSYTYDALARIAEWDARQLGRASPRMLERGPRALTTLEKNLRRSLDRPSWIRGQFGFDSSVERAKHDDANGPGISTSPIDAITPVPSISRNRGAR